VLVGIVTARRTLTRCILYFPTGKRTNRPDLFLCWLLPSGSQDAPLHGLHAVEQHGTFGCCLFSTIVKFTNFLNEHKKKERGQLISIVVLRFL